MHVKTSIQEKVFLGIVYSFNWGVHICGLYESDLDVLRVHLHIISGRVIIQAPYFIHSYISLLRYSLTVGSKTVSLNIHASSYGTRGVYTFLVVVILCHARFICINGWPNMLFCS